MNKEEITPALNFQSEVANEMSAEEFQRTLSKWFEDRGLLAELRAHLRAQMIGILQDTTLGRTSSGQINYAISPKLQTLNLLIAEFLLCQNYHYTLSVFSTEVPLINVLPEFTGHIANEHMNKKKQYTKWRFSEKDMWDILETLGIVQGSTEGTDIFKLYYYNKNDESLLICIIRTWNSLYNTKRNTFRTGDKDDAQGKLEILPTHSARYLQTFNDLLKGVNVSPELLPQLTAQLNEIVSSEVTRIQNENKNNVLNHEEKLKATSPNKQENGDVYYDSEFKKMQEEIKAKQIAVDQLAENLQTQNCTLQSRLDELTLRDDAVTKRESNICDKEEKLKKMEQQLQSAFALLKSEQTTITHLRKKLESHLTATQQEPKKEEKPQLTSNVQETLVNANSKTDLFEKKLEQLQKENDVLKLTTVKQNSRIKDLSNRAASLRVELDTSEEVIMQLRHRNEIPHSDGWRAPFSVATRPALGHSRRSVNSSYGGGEDAVFGLLPRTPRTYRNLFIGRDHRTRASRRVSHGSSSSDSYSPTDNILKEARQKLSQLEQESNEVDQQYKDFKARQVDTGAPLETSWWFKNKTNNNKDGTLKNGDNSTLLLVNQIQQRHQVKQSTGQEITWQAHCNSKLNTIELDTNLPYFHVNTPTATINKHTFMPGSSKESGETSKILRNEYFHNFATGKWEDILREKTTNLMQDNNAKLELEPQEQRPSTSSSAFINELNAADPFGISLSPFELSSNVESDENLDHV